MTVFIVQTRAPLIPVKLNTKQLFRQTQHLDAIPHSATCFLSSEQGCYKRLRNICNSQFLRYLQLITT